MEAVALWPNKKNFNFCVVSIDHATRTDSGKEADFVVSRARELGFLAESITLPKASKKDESTLRSLRYAALVSKGVELGSDFICTAHHEDDDAEGMMMDLLGFGGGACGAAMADSSDAFDLPILRPFLKLSKTDLTNALNALNILDYFTDPLDEAGISRRAHVRKKIIPMLEVSSPNIRKRLAERGRLIGNYDRALAPIVNSLLTFNETKEKAVIHVRACHNLFLLKLACKQALARVSLSSDNRQSAETLSKVVSTAQNLYGIEKLGIDPRGDSVTLSARLGRNSYVFDFKGAQIALTNQGMSVVRVKS